MSYRCFPAGIFSQGRCWGAAGSQLAESCLGLARRGQWTPTHRAHSLQTCPETSASHEKERLAGAARRGGEISSRGEKVLSILGMQQRHVQLMFSMAQCLCFPLHLPADWAARAQTVMGAVAFVPRGSPSREGRETELGFCRILQNFTEFFSNSQVTNVALLHLFLGSHCFHSCSINCIDFENSPRKHLFPEPIMVISTYFKCSHSWCFLTLCFET